MSWNSQLPEADIELIQEISASASAGFASNSDANVIFLLFCGVLVFFMHAGFAMLEGGSVKNTSVANIMFKNIGTISIGAVFFWLFGYGFAYGIEDDEGDLTKYQTNDGIDTGDGYNGFIGYTDFGYTNTFEADKIGWFFQMVFAATAATIVSGAVAGRIKLEAYFLITVVLTAFVYPVVVHWVWATEGWISAFAPSNDLAEGCGMIDYAGSGVVHMTGGVAAFWGALILGPRAGWTAEEGIPAHNKALSALGTFILWFGWFGFNCGSALAWDGANAGHVAVTTTLAPSAATLIAIAYAKIAKKAWDIDSALNAVLGGLVSITAGCSTISAPLSLVVGLIGGLVYVGSSKLIKKIGIDDPVDASPVHGFCGMWGVIAPGLFAGQKYFDSAYSGNPRGCDVEDRGAQLTFQIVGLVAIFAWVTVFSVALFGGLKLAKKLKLSEEEQKDLDGTEHGAAAYNLM